MKESTMLNDMNDTSFISSTKEEKLRKKKKKKKKEKKDVKMKQIKKDELKKKKKEKKKRKREEEEENKQENHNDDDASCLIQTNETICSPKKKRKTEKKSKKQKQKKKEQNHKKNHDETKEKNDSTNYHDSNGSSTKMKPIMKVGDELVNGRIVSSSAKISSMNADNNDDTTTTTTNNNNNASSSNCSSGVKDDDDDDDVTLLLFYQYVDPMWDDDQFHQAMQFVQSKGKAFGLTGRMRVAKEGLNCTLTGSYQGVRQWCAALRKFDGGYFKDTEFKLTDHLPRGQLFPKLHAFHVEEIVNYGLNGEKAPSIAYTGQHLEPHEYHEKMTNDNTVIIDVRNHYEAAIGQFVPPSGGAKYIDPLMRKSTEFPLWLDKPETKNMLKDKHVLMYCTGGVRCERASALLKQKMDQEEDTKALNIQGVYQLQGGIDKYFKAFPQGGWWKGKNYVFDKRFSHAPPAIENHKRNTTTTTTTTEESSKMEQEQKMGQCTSCSKPWDMYRGKHRCPTCGVPSLICRDCHERVNKRDKTLRCDLCVKQNITHKSQLRQKEQTELQQYEQKHYPNLLSSKHNNNNNNKSTTITMHNNVAVDNPNKITRLYIHNMNKQSMDETTLCETIPGITHIQWVYGGRNTTGNKTWLGSANVEMATPQDASLAVGQNGITVLGRSMYISFAPPDPKDVWPPPNTRIT